MDTNSIVDSLRLSREIRINRANNDARVLRAFPMQADDMAAIAGFLDGQHVVTEHAQFLHDRQGKFLLE